MLLRHTQWNSCVLLSHNQNYVNSTTAVKTQQNVGHLSKFDHAKTIQCSELG